MHISLDKHIEEQRELYEFFESFPYDRGNDREIVIVGCAYLESLIKSALTEFLVQDENEIRILLDEGNGSLPGLVQRARLLYLVDLIPQIIYKDLKNIGKIRNHFAHNVGACFEETRIKDLCVNLQWHVYTLMKKPPEGATSRDIYQVAVNQLVSYLGAIPGQARLRRNARGT